MHKVSERPLIFLAEPPEEDSRLDIGFNDPNLLNDFGGFDDVRPLSSVLTDICYGTSIKCHDDPKDTDIPVLRMNNLVDGIIRYEDLVYASRQDVETLLLDNSDILINRTNGSKNLVGKCALYQNHNDHSFASYLLRIKVDSIEVLPEFVVLYLQSKMGRKEIDRRSFGAPQCNLSIGHIKNIKIPIMSIQRQQIILERFGIIDAAWRKLQAKVSELKQSAFASTNLQLNELFASELKITTFVEAKRKIVFLRNPNASDRLDVLSNHPDFTRLVSQIRECAASGALSDLVEVSEDRFNPDEHIGQEINYLAIGDIDGISGNIIEPQKMIAEDLPSRARRLIHAGDILVGIAGASTGTENMVVFPVTSEQEGWVATTGFLVLRPRAGVDIHYVCILIKAPFVLRQIRALLTSPAMPTISENDVMQLAVPVTNSATRKTTLKEINKVLLAGYQLTIQLEQISKQIEQLLSEAKSNIFDLLDDDKFSAMSARSMDIEAAMGKIEEALQ